MVKNNKYTLPTGTKVPDHIAIVLDGNGRWARARGMSPTKGHEESSKRFREVIEACREFGVHTLTVWGFSTENWKRPPAEVRKILSIIRSSLSDYRKDAMKEGVRVVHLGRKDRFPGRLRKLIEDIEEETRSNTNYVLNIALDYGGRDEIIRAVKKIVDDGVPAKKITEDLFSTYLDTGDQPYPNPDLFIRPSGEQRTSGLMPWQITYAEYYWEQSHLPDVTSEQIKEAILDYSCRRRRFGGKDRVGHFKFRPEVTAKFELAWWRLAKIPEGTRFADYAIKHIKEQYGMSLNLSKKAAKYMAQAVLQGEGKKWGKAKENLFEFYKLVRDEVKLAFEPSLAASLNVKLWREIGDSQNELSAELDDTAIKLYSEVYRISSLQASKMAHLRVMASMERKMAQDGMGDYHWDRAEDYLEKFYRALKDRVA